MEWTFLVIGLAVAIAVAAVCYRIAEGKGRSGALWAVLGFFFPVIALVVVFVLPDRRGA
jgi:membrane associated rhomboid family serine protease